MAMELRDYFRIRCSELLIMERDVWLLLNLMAQESAAPALKEMLAQRGDPARQRISNLEQIADRLDGVTGPQEQPLSQAMIRAHRQLLELRPPRQIVDIQNALLTDEIEAFFVAAYTGLLALARQLGEQEIAPLLEQNLLSEEHLRAKADSELPVLLSDLSAQLRRAA